MELEVKYITKTIKLLLQYTDDVEIIERYLEKMRIALYNISEIYKTNEMFVYRCSVLPLIYVLLREQERGWVPYTWYITTDKYTVLLPLIDENDDEEEACFVVEPYKEYDP